MKGRYFVSNLKKGNKPNYSKYRRITLINVAYQVFCQTLFRHLSSLVKQFVDQYQVGFMRICVTSTRLLPSEIYSKNVLSTIYRRITYSSTLTVQLHDFTDDIDVIAQNCGTVNETYTRQKLISLDMNTYKTKYMRGNASKDY